MAFALPKNCGVGGCIQATTGIGPVGNGKTKCAQQAAAMMSYDIKRVLILCVCGMHATHCAPHTFARNEQDLNLISAEWILN